MTLFIAHDLDVGVAVWLFTGPANSEDDYRRYLETILALDAARADEDAAGLVVADPGNPPPPSVWRRKIADATRTIQSRTAFALVSSSPVMRGVMTAINWLRPPPYRSRACASVDDATAWLEKELGRPLPIARLIEDARAQAAGR